MQTGDRCQRCGLWVVQFRGLAFLPPTLKINVKKKVVYITANHSRISSPIYRLRTAWTNGGRGKYAINIVGRSLFEPFRRVVLRVVEAL